jgi:hypothetical protein
LSSLRGTPAWPVGQEAILLHFEIASPPAGGSQ